MLGICPNHFATAFLGYYAGAFLHPPLPNMMRMTLQGVDTEIHFSKHVSKASLWLTHLFRPRRNGKRKKNRKRSNLFLATNQSLFFLSPERRGKLRQILLRVLARLNEYKRKSPVLAPLHAEDGTRYSVMPRLFST